MFIKCTGTILNDITHYTALAMLHFTVDCSCLTQLVSTYLNPMP